MRSLRAFAMRVAGLLGFVRRDWEIAEELEAHVRMLEDEYRRAGLTDGEARRAAAARFGSVGSAVGAYRDRRGVPALENWMRECTHAVRSLRRSPVLVLSMVLVLGLGTGISTAVATVFHSAVWSGLPVPESDRVVKMSLTFTGEFSRHVRGDPSRFSYPELTAYRDAARTLEGVAGVDHQSVTWRRDAEIRSLSAALVTGDYFRTLRVRPATGRLFAEGDSRRPVAVISQRLWLEIFGGAPDVLGRGMNLDRSWYSVIGVAADPFTGTEANPVDVWLPLEAASALRGEERSLSEQNVSWLQVVGRLEPEASLTTAAAEGAVIGGRFDLHHPERHTRIQIARASRLDAGLLQSRERGIVIGVVAIGAALVGLLLLICGSNVAALLLARGATRQGEIALRVALGAGRARIAQGLIAEVAIIAAAGAAVGLLVCTWLLHVLADRVPLHGLLETLSPDVRVFTFAAGSALSVALLFGLAPVRQALQVDCLSALKGRGEFFGSRMPMARLRQWLVAIQVAVSVILIVAAVLLGRGIERAFHVDPGYPTGNLYIVRSDRDPTQDAAGFGRRWRLLQQVRDGLASEPGVVAVGLATIQPFWGRGVSSVGRESATELVPVQFNRVDERYFPALGVSPIAGRLFTAQEPGVVLVNASLARKFWGDESAALNRSLHLPADMAAGRPPRTVTVIGVVPTIQTNDIGLPDAPTYYQPINEDSIDQAVLVVRALDRTPVARLAIDKLRRFDSSAVGSVVSVEDRIAGSTGAARLAAAVAGIIGGLALLVAAVGIHGIIAHAVVCRTRDIGVYLALGASRRQVLRTVLEPTLRGAILGALGGAVIAGVLGASFADQFKRVLFGVTPLDPLAFLGAAGILLAVIIIAAYVPARHALGVGPSTALRHDA
jgi:predicted permease